MKKNLLFIGAFFFAVASAAVFTAFAEPTEQEKMDKAYNELKNQFFIEQMATCLQTADAKAVEKYDQEAAEAAEGKKTTTTTGKTTTKPTTGGGGTQNTTTTTTTTTTTGKTDPKTDGKLGGNTTDAKTTGKLGGSTTDAKTEGKLGTKQEEAKSKGKLGGK